MVKHYRAHQGDGVEKEKQVERKEERDGMGDGLLIDVKSGGAPSL